MIPDETVKKILDTAQVEEVISDYVTLKRRGASYVACCPFHNEKTPSFYVTPSKGIFKCFGCGKAGTSIGFVMEYGSEEDDYRHRTLNELSAIARLKADQIAAW